MWRKFSIRSLPFLAALVAVAGVIAWLLWSSLFPVRLAAHMPAVVLAPVGNGEAITPLSQSIRLDAGKVALGNRLFHDKRLSHDDSVACAGCHDLSKGGADGRRHAVGIGGQEGTINAPSVFNSGFNFKQFWDGRAATLEDQIDGPVNNPRELGSSWPEVIAKLRQDPQLTEAFARIYPDGIQAANIKDAIATFERSLITPDSRFDRFLRGDRSAITADELKGYRLFQSYGCVSCHQGVNIGGNMFARLGVMRDYFKDRGHATPVDLGRFNVTGLPEHTHVFKVPSLRNVALTAPYLHDGSQQTLEQAVATMGKYQLNVTIPLQDATLIANFLRTLTGEHDGKPL